MKFTEQIFSLLAAKTPDAFETLLAENVVPVQRAVLRLTSSAEDAEDLFQSFIVQVYERQDDFLNAPNPSAYLLRSLKNHYIDNWRSNRHKPLSNRDSQIEVQDFSTGDDVEQKAMQQQLGQRLITLLDELPPERRLVLVLHDIEGYSLPELEQTLGIPLGTLKSRLHRARAALRLELGWEPFQ